jgi:bacillithiol biosynthesis deacetylase BshB1
MADLDALVIAPHPDDAELGMAGAILRMIDDGMSVGILDLTDGEPTPHGDVETRAAETAAASQLLGITWRENLGLPNRSLQATLAAREALANVIRRARPRWLFAPYWTDAHPDHVAAVRLIDDARFWAKLTKSALIGMPFHPQRVFHYLSVHLRITVNPDFVLDITRDWPKKRQSLECYQSQFVIGRAREKPSVIERVQTAAAYWGHLIGAEYGEPFTCREPIGMRSMRDLC